MERIRLTGKELFVYYHKVLADDNKVQVGGCTNKVILAQKSGIGYDNLVRIFTREKKCYYDNGDTIILKLSTSRIEKGKQSIVRRGKGGMERFKEKYLINKRNDY